jgi:hypothetical protein
LGLAALVALWLALASVGPGEAGAEPEKTPERAAEIDVSQLRREVAEWEGRYRAQAGSEVPGTEAIDALGRAVESQRALVRLVGRTDYTAQTELERLQSELAVLEARRDNPVIEELRQKGETAQAAGAQAEAENFFREALALQNRINAGAAPTRSKNYARSTALEQALASVQVLPLQQAKEEALEKARSAAKEERWPDALAGYVAAREAQQAINRDHGRTRFANIAELDRIEAEIASLNAAGLAARSAELEAQGEERARSADEAAAAEAFAEAWSLQQQINDHFSRSRFVSATRLATLEEKLQTARSRPLAAELANKALAIDEELRRRRVAAAEQAIPRAVELAGRLEKEFPRSRAIDAGLRAKLAYLSRKSGELRRLQDEVYARLLPLPGLRERLLLGGECSQALYSAVMDTNPSRSVGRALPVDSVSWKDAAEFCTRLGWILGETVRLPKPEELRQAHGVGGGEVRSSLEGIRPAGAEQVRANANGFWDILGNLAEWVAAPDDAANAPVLGGSYLDTPEALESFPTESRPKTDRARHIGFRFVVERRAER